MSQRPDQPFVIWTLGHPMWLRFFELESFEPPCDVEVQLGEKKPVRIVLLRPDSFYVIAPKDVACFAHDVVPVDTADRPDSWDKYYGDTRFAFVFRSLDKRSRMKKEGGAGVKPSHGTNGCLVPGNVSGVNGLTRGYVGGYYLYYDTKNKRRYWVQERYSTTASSWQLVVWGPATWRTVPAPLSPPVPLAEFEAGGVRVRLRPASSLSEGLLAEAARW